MPKGYFQRVSKLSPTQFWINNPTRIEADLAIESGATGCTLNPSYTQKMLDHPEEGDYALEILKKVVKEVKDDNKAIAEFQRRMAKPICDKFIPLFNNTGKEKGYVSIQADPILEDDPEIIITEGRLNRSVSPNVCCKIPTTKSGLKAMETLIPENTNINATEIFALQQGIDLGELYESLVPKNSNGPKLWYSHIAGIYDDSLNKYRETHEVDILPDILAQAGLAVSKKLYQLVKERKYRMSFIGGGARQTYHFTELVGGDVNLTINWKGTADKLIEMDQPVVWRIFNPIPESVLDELIAKFPDFKKGYFEDGINVDEYDEFAPVELFRSSFMNSWKKVLDIIRKLRS